MSQLKEKLDYFRVKQTDMMKLNAELEPKRREIQEEFNKRMTELNAPLVKMGEEYKAELKAFCGITDGERTNVLELLSAVEKVQELGK